MWTFLYLSMGYASYLVFTEGSGQAMVTAAIFYFLQLAFNFAWTPVFFGGGQFALAGMILGVMWGLIVATIVTFFPISTLAGGLLIPYLGWVSFAGILNYSLTCLNGPIFDVAADNKSD